MSTEAIAVIGSGLMGHGIAQAFAVRGHAVTVVDPHAASLTTVPERVHANLTTLAHQQIDLGADIDTIVRRIALTTDLEQGVAGATFVFEAVFEDLALKQDLFARLDRACPPHTVLCSNTSVISITAIATRAEHQERIIGTHWWNPPYLIPLVEIVRTERAADWCLDATYELLTRAGKQPVHVHRDVPGFVGNRLQHALWREAFALIDAGICDAATIDTVVQNSFGLRMPVLGPMVNADLIGLDLALAVHTYLFPHLTASALPSSTLRAKVARNELGFKTGGGMFPWTEDTSAAVREQLVTYLLTALSERQR